MKLLTATTFCQKFISIIKTKLNFHTVINTKIQKNMVLDLYTTLTDLFKLQNKLKY